MASAASRFALFIAILLSWFVPVNAPAQVHHSTVFGDRLCPDALPYDSVYANSRDYVEYQELMFVLWRQSYGCLDGDRWNDCLSFRENARKTYPFMADAFGHWDTPLRDFGLCLGMFESGSYTLSPPTVGDLVEFEILIGWMEMEQNATPWFIPAGGESIRAFVPYLHTKNSDDPPLGHRFGYLAEQKAFQKSTHEVLIGLVTLLGEAPIEHFEAFKAWLNVGDLALTAEEISRAGGSKLLFFSAGSWADNLYRGTQGEMAYGNEANDWTVLGAGLSGAHEGAGGGLLIFFDTLSFGQISNSEDYDFSVFDGAEYDGARFASTLTRDTLIIVGAGGGAPALFAGRTALAAGQTFNAVNAYIGATAISYGMYGHLVEGNYLSAGIEGTMMLVPGAGNLSRFLPRGGRLPRQVSSPPVNVKPQSAGMSAAEPPSGFQRSFPTDNVRLALPYSGPSVPTIKHHIFNKFRGSSPNSQYYRDFYKKHGINVDDFTVKMPEAFHKQWIHRAGNNWTTKWKRWIDANPNATTTEVYQQAGKMMDEYGINHLPLVPYR